MPVPPCRANPEFKIEFTYGDGTCLLQACHRAVRGTLGRPRLLGRPDGEDEKKAEMEEVFRESVRARGVVRVCVCVCVGVGVGVGVGVC